MGSCHNDCDPSLTCAYCAACTEMGALYIFSPLLPMVLYVTYGSFTDEETEAHRDFFFNTFLNVTESEPGYQLTGQ